MLVSFKEEAALGIAEDYLGQIGLDKNN